MSLRVDGKRLLRDLAELAEIGRDPGGGLSRTSFTPADAQARAWYAAKCEEAGLTLELDALGNMVAGLPGRHDEPAVWSGSHLDTVPHGGAFDGALGAVAALECVRRLAESGPQLTRPVRAVVFSDEEGNYNHLLGSTAMRRGFSEEELAAMTGRDGDRLVDALDGWPWARGSRTDTRVDPARLHAFAELHIEQGPTLEQQGIRIGVVTSIIGLSGGLVRFHGRADHAGTTPMDARSDALLAAAQFIGAMPGLARASGPASVITTGRVRVQPGGTNQVPELAEVSLDFRDPSRERVAAMLEAIGRSAQEAAAAHGVRAEWHPDEIVDPVPLDEGMRALIADCAADLGLSSIDIASGAGHDSQNMALLTPTAMIFVPSRDGRSHVPVEYTTDEDVVAGADVLLATLRRLADT
ncbi:MAG: N-carbamoyl-L-amino-acid hydrolase [Blastococcus sp.]|nr:N-carbamoyl-L-amino-acid hydrolase [Blastococcus sp.]